MNIINVGNKVINNYLIELNDGYLMVDTGYPLSYKKFIKRLKKNDIPLSDIRYVFLTHSHDDHAGFLNELLMNTKTRVILHPEAIEYLKKGQNSFEGGCTSKLAYIFCKFMELLGKGEHLFPPVTYVERFIVLNEEVKKQLEEELMIQIVNLPGHTDDSIGFVANDILFCGDAAANGILSKNRTIIWVKDLKQYKKTWDYIINLNPKIIYPSHGKPFMVNDLKKRINNLDKIKLYSLKKS